MIDWLSSFHRVKSYLVLSLSFAHFCFKPANERSNENGSDTWTKRMSNQ